jgi:hypothetical protein
MNSLSSILTGITKDLKHFPYRHELISHPLFGPAFSSMSEIEKHDIEKSIHSMMTERIMNPKTLGAEYFQRFYDNHTDLFRQFRGLNEYAKDADSEAFQHLGKQVENEIYKLEALLTQRQTGKNAK